MSDPSVIDANVTLWRAWAALLGRTFGGAGGTARRAVLYLADVGFRGLATAAIVCALLGTVALPTSCHGPTPPPPGPTDPLAAALQAAYAADADPQKAAKLAALADFYAGVVPAAKAGGVATLADLQARVHAGADVVAGPGGMPSTRLAASHYVASKMPANDGPMTDPLWAAAAGAYGDVAAALKEVK